MKNLLFITLVSLLMTACVQNQIQSTENLPKNLIGVETLYSYSGGNGYNVKFEKEGLSYQFRSGSSPEKFWGPFDYNHMITENREHFVSWFEPGYGDYVTLLINFETNIIYGSAIIKGKTVHFQKGSILETKIN